MKLKIIILLLLILLLYNRLYCTGYCIISRKKHTFNSWINSIKYIRIDEKKKFADKYYARKYVENNFNIKCIPALYILNKPEELLNIRLKEKCFIKCSNGSGFNIFYDPSINDNLSFIISRLNIYLRINYNSSLPFKLLRTFYEPQYRNKFENRKIIIEKYIDNIINYNFFIIYGKIAFINVRYVKSNKRYNENYDLNWNKLPFFYFKNTFTNTKKPSYLKKMINFCDKFYNQKKFKFMRVDFMGNDKNLYFAEFTFTPYSSRGYLSNNYDKIIFNKFIKNRK